MGQEKKVELGKAWAQTGPWTDEAKTHCSSKEKAETQACGDYLLTAFKRFLGTHDVPATHRKILEVQRWRVPTQFFEILEFTLEIKSSEEMSTLEWVKWVC